MTTVTTSADDHDPSPERHDPSGAAAPDAGPAAITIDLVDGLLHDFLRVRHPSSQRAYLADLAHFAVATGATGPVHAVYHLLAHGPAAAHQIARQYQTLLVHTGYAVATTNRRISLLRGLVNAAGLANLVLWPLRIRSLPYRAKPYVPEAQQDTAGMLIRSAEHNPHRIRACRDTAILSLIAGSTLCNHEIVELDIEHVDIPSACLMLREQRDPARTPVPLAPRVWDALLDWLHLRGMDDGPVFYVLHRSAERKPLSCRAIHALVQAYGRRCRIPINPRRLRQWGIHTAVSSPQHVFAIRRFVRRHSLNTFLPFDDVRYGSARDVATTVDAHLSSPSGSAASSQRNHTTEHSDDRSS